MILLALAILGQELLFGHCIAPGESALFSIVEKFGGEGYEYKMSLIGEGSPPFDSKDLDGLDWFSSVTPDFRTRKLVFPDDSQDVVSLLESYVFVSMDKLYTEMVQRLSLPSGCTGSELSLGVGPNPSLYIACSSEGRLMELYKKEDGQYAIDDDVFSAAGATTTARVGSGLVFTRNGNTLEHKASITSGDSPQGIDVIVNLDCGTPYPKTYTDTHILLECSNGHWYLCSIQEGCLEEPLNLPLYAKIASLPNGLAAVLSSSSLTLYSNNFDSNCSPIILDDPDVILEFHNDKLLIKSLNAFHYVGVADCPSSPSLLTTFTGVPLCFTGNCTDYTVSSRYLAITTQTDGLVTLIFYDILTMERLDYVARYHSAPVLYVIIDGPDVTMATTTIAATTTTVATTTVVMATTSTSSTTPTPDATTQPTSSREPFFTKEVSIPIGIGIGVVVLSIVIAVVLSCYYRCRKSKKKDKVAMAELPMPTQAQDNDSTSSFHTSSLPSLQCVQALYVQPPIQETTQCAAQ